MANETENVFLLKKTENINDLESCLEDGYEKRTGFNEKTTLNNDTRLLIVGSAVPPDISYFYTGRFSYMYKWIDEVRETKLRRLQDNINLTRDSEKKEKYVEEIRKILYEQRIAFLDIAHSFITKIGSRSDSHIKKYFFNRDDFKCLYDNKDITIIAVTPNAKSALERFLGFKNIQCIPIFCKSGWNKNDIIDVLESTK